MPGLKLSSYVGSTCFRQDLAAVRRVWSLPTVLETAGTFVFLTYLAVPVLLSVRSPGGSLARPVLDGDRERRFLLRVLGLTDSPDWHGGIGNHRICRLVNAMNDYHWRMPGMSQDYLNYIAAAIALAPLRVRESMAAELSGDDRARYWRYISAAMALFGAGLVSEDAAENMCEAFTVAHAGYSAAGVALMKALKDRHPRYVALATPILFDASRLVVAAALLKEMP
jgi:hypothetical protein